MTEHASLTMANSSPPASESTTASCKGSPTQGADSALGMTDAELIGYCDIHCETERALFNERQINRMIELAGYPDEFVREVRVGWYSVHQEMKELVRLARERVGSEPSGPLR
jgi:hypothetical protein